MGCEQAVGDQKGVLLGKRELGWASHCITHADVLLMQPLKHTIPGKIT